MLQGDIVLGAILAAVCLATAMGVVAIPKSVLGEERPTSGDSGINASHGDGDAAKAWERRRSERRLRRVSLFAYSHAPGESPFHEETTTSEISSHGGLLSLAARVSVGQKLLLTNVASQEEQECYVVRFTRKDPQKKGDVAIEFTRAAPDFWRTRAGRPRRPGTQ